MRLQAFDQQAELRDGNNKPDNRLPRRLFTTDRFPSARLNIYSKPDILPFIQHVLRNTKELQYLKNSCFGKLFELPARQCPVSCKLIHAFLTRQLICEDSHTLWTVFRSDPIRFGLQEFGTITGLPCGELPSDYETELEDQSQANKDPDWIKLIGKKKFVTIADLRHRLETDTRMPGSKKLQLALILIVDGVLIAHQQKTRPTLKYVKMVQNIDAFCQHPWGRESFLKTITCMKPPEDCKDPTGELVSLLRQETFRLKGFPLALQLLAFQAVPQLQTIIPAPVDTLSISQLEEPHLPLISNINYVDILRVEAVQNLAVTSLIPIHCQIQPITKVPADERVKYMEDLIANRYQFEKHMWPGGDRSGPILIYKPPEEQRASKRNVLNPRKTINKPSTSRSQRRISNYFPRTSSTCDPNAEILQMLTKVSTQLSKLRKENKVIRQLIKRRKSRSHSKRSAFHSLISCSKKRHISNRGCQTDPMDQNTDDPPEVTCPTHMEEDQTHCNSPLISQYAAQHYGQLQHTSPGPDPTEHTSPVPAPTEPTSPYHNSPEHTSPVHNTTDHTSPVHNSPEHTSPVHNSPEHTPLDHNPADHTATVPNLPAEMPEPSGTPDWLCTPKSPPVIYRSYIYDKKNHPNSPEFHHLLQQGLEIFEHISPEASSQDNPRYDTSTRRDPPQPITPDTSPTKSSGFAEHASSVNAFAATGTSKETSKATSKGTSIPILNFDQSPENLAEEDCVDLSDSSPARPTPSHQLSDEERHLAAELIKCPSVPALSILAPLPQTQWDLFFSTLKGNNEA
ncbi:hypothetical protein Bca101_068628 [Brassica carinata]